MGEVLFDVFPCCRWLGGAPFNFIYHINKLLGTGNFISRVGDDDPGGEILQKMAKENIPVDFVQTDKLHPTGAAVVEVQADGEPRFTIKEDCAYDFIKITPEVRGFMEKSAGLLYFGSLAQRNSISREAIRSLWGYGIKYFCDINIRQQFFNKNIISSSLRAADVLKVNFKELQLITEILNGAASGMDTAVKYLMATFHIDLLCVTMGADGAVLYKGNEKDSAKARVSQIADTVGAGDAYSAILAIGYMKGWPIKRINGIATEFASGICQIEGALPLDDDFYTDFRMLIGRQ